MTDYQKQLVTDNHNLIYRFLQKEKLNMEDWYDLAAIGNLQKIQKISALYNLNLNTM